MTVLRLTNSVMHYAWGSTTVIPRLLGREPDGQPAAELWMGAHAGAPSIVTDDPQHRSLAEVIGLDPDVWLGHETARRFGAALPFLLKVLAIERPLSLQAHPDIRRARSGFAAENAQGVEPGSAQRNYKDANHKPELVCALTPFQGLCGFRPVQLTAQFLDALGAQAFLAYRERLLADGGLRDVVTCLLTMDESSSTGLLSDLLLGAGRVAGSEAAWAAEAGWLLRLGEAFPADRGVALAALLNLVGLDAGEALFLAPGQLHAYLDGTAVELMASSDNVLRGGLTSKHVDVAELVRVLQFTEGPADVLVAVPGSEGMHWYPDVAPDFRLGRTELDADRSVERPAGLPQLLFCAHGVATVSNADSATTELPRGHAVFVPATDAVSLTAREGTLVFVATCGDVRKT